MPDEVDFDAVLSELWEREEIRLRARLLPEDKRFLARGREIRRLLGEDAPTPSLDDPRVKMIDDALKDVPGTNPTVGRREEQILISQDILIIANWIGRSC